MIWLKVLYLLLSNFAKTPRQLAVYQVQFGLYIECNCSHGLKEAKILKFQENLTKVRLNWGNISYWGTILVKKLNFTRVGPWKIIELGCIWGYTSHFLGYIFFIRSNIFQSFCQVTQQLRNISYYLIYYSKLKIVI